MLNFNSFKALIQIPILLLLLLSFAILAPAAQAQTTVPWSDEGTCVKTMTTTTTDGGSDTVHVATIQGLQCLVANVLSVVISVIGLIGFVMMIIASFSYLLSGGNSKGIENARNTITYAIVGLVVALSSVIILNLLAAFTGVSLITNFKIPSSDCGIPGNAPCQPTP